MIEPACKHRIIESQKFHPNQNNYRNSILTAHIRLCIRLPISAGGFDNKIGIKRFILKNKKESKEEIE
jgi:hypothetical protein